MADAHENVQRHRRRRVRPPCYQTWINMRRWCGYLKSATPYQRSLYEGIGICDEWLDYKTFETWCLSHGFAKGLHLVRIDKNADYCPSNCKFLPIERANGIRRCVRRLEDGRTVREVIGYSGLGRDRDYYSRVSKRILESHWDIGSALTAPAMNCRQARQALRQGKETT